MKIKKGKELEYATFFNTNSGFAYGYGVVKYMLRWTDMMEDLIDKGFTVAQAAEQTEYKADTEGISGFMFGCAVNALNNLWQYGDELRIWHNSRYNYDGDGTVNPALLTVKEK